MVQLKFTLWLRSVWSEPTGGGSNSRLNATLVTVAALALVWFVTVRRLDIPAGAQVILLTLLGASTTAYGLNKVGAGRTASQATTQATAPETTGETP